MQVAQDKIAGSLWALFIGDALAMPVHWYYDIRGTNPLLKT